MLSTEPIEFEYLDSESRCGCCSLSKDTQPLLATHKCVVKRSLRRAAVELGFSNCGTPKTTGTPNIVYCYKALRTNRNKKGYNFIQE